jgi:NAD-dependent dihydropyrimidine dehydrogenase PreA subunit
MNIFPFLHLRETKYIRLSPRQCQGCWECVEVCPADVLVKMGRGPRRHVHIKNPDACTGCKKCVRVCKNAAIEYTYVPGSARSAGKHLPGEEYGK